MMGLIILALLLTSCPGGTEVPGGRDFDWSREIYVINTLADTFSVINAETLEIVNDIQFSGGSDPNQIVEHEGKLYLVNSSSNLITRFDETTLEEEGDLYLGVGRNPYNMIIESDTSRAWVTNYIAGTVALVDLDGFSVSAELEVGTGPQGGCYIDGKLWICNTGKYTSSGYTDSSISVIDTDAEVPVVAATIDSAALYSESLGAGSNPQAAIAFPDRNEVHIILTCTNGGDDADDGQILILDSTDYSEIARLDIGGSPGWNPGAVDEGRGIVYLTGVGGLQAYNYETRVILNDSSNYIVAGDNSATDLYSGVVHDSGSDQLFLTFFSGDEILVLDGEDYTLIEGGEIAGSDGPMNPLLVVE